MNGSFATLNRLLGKKNKDPSLSKSTSNIHDVVPTLDTSSQYNKIVPLAGMSEAPFEQTFRITIQLPREQLYVARLGAKMKLNDLLKKICDDKQLDRDKFVFRHPADKTQIFNNNLTIGEVGLNEYCLVLKKDKYYINNNNNYTNNNNENLNRINTDDKYKLRDSISSTEMNRNSKIFRKISPYSSTNSLNSIDSSGVSSVSQPPIAPKRKKRAAPRPPSSNSTNDVTNENINEKPSSQLVMPRKNFHLSTPNLSNGFTGNEKKEIRKLSINNEEVETEYYSSVTELNKIERESSLPIRITSEHNETNITNSSLPDFHTSGHDPVPKQRIYLAAKKKKAAPCPPPRVVPPVPTPRSTTPKMLHVDDDLVEKPAVITGNVSKIMLNVDTASYSSTEIPQVSNGQTKECEEQTLNVNKNLSEDTKSKISQSDSVSIHVKSPIIERANEANFSQDNCDKISLSSTKTYSSDEDDSKVNVYYLKSPSTVTTNAVRVPSIKKAELGHLTNGNVRNEKVQPVIVVIPKVIEEEQSPIGEKDIYETADVKLNKNEIIDQKVSKIQEITTRAESPLWTYTLPAPPKFADENNAIIQDSMTITTEYYNDYESSADNITTLSESNTTCVSDLDIKPIIKERHSIENHLYGTDLIPNIHDLENSGDVITSDIEDGYKGDLINRDVLIETLKRRRENLVENEFAFLSKFDDDISSGEENIEEDKDIVEDFKSHHSNEIVSVPASTPKTELPQINTNIVKKDPVREEFKEIINQNQITEEIVKNHMNSVISRNEVSQDYLDNRRSSLSNFKIESYTATPTHTELKTVERVEVNNHIVDDNKASIVEEHHSEAVVFRRPRDYVSVKRRSLTNSFIMPPSSGPQINRSDSFHSTRQATESSYVQAPEHKLPLRSSSYISLIGAQKFENKISTYHVTRQQSFAQSKRKSSSELSITDSPSLQSVEVMKSIMRSSNGYLNGEKEKSTKEPEEPKKEDPPTTEKKPILNGNQPVAAQIDSKEVEIVEVREEKENNKSKITEKEVVKRWTYQGPPTISLSSWNERPKAQVSIKNDRDYKFGANTKFEKQGNKQSSSELLSILNKRKTISDFPNIPPEKEDRLPAIRSVEYKSNVNIVAEGSDTLNNGFQLPKPKIAQNSGNVDYLASSKLISHPQMNSNVKSTPQVNSSEIVDKDYKSLPAFLHKPLPTPVKPITPVNNFINHNVVPKPIVRSTSEQPRSMFKISAYDSDSKKDDPPSFYKVTLRQTGLKDKILSPEPVNENAINVKDFPMLAASLKKTAEPVKREQTLKSPVVVMPPAPPPALPKLAPVVRAVVKKPLPTQVDPRDQLLDAIRNFNKHKLNKS